MMAAQRKNIEAFTALNQAAMESYQSLAQRQAELARQTIADATGVFERNFVCPITAGKSYQASGSLQSCG